MSHPQEKSTLSRLFDAAVEQPKSPKSSKKKRQPPLSIRLNEKERTRLERDAAGKPLSTYAKERIFRVSSRKSPAIKDKQALARILRTLGQTGLIDHLAAVIRQIDGGKVMLSDQEQNKIRAACAAALLMRADLIAALGLKPE